MNIIDELEALAATISNVSSVLVHFHFLFSNKIIFLGHPPVYLSPPSPTIQNTTMLSLYSLENIKYVLFTT